MQRNRFSWHLSHERQRSCQSPKNSFPKNAVAGLDLSNGKATAGISDITVEPTVEPASASLEDHRLAAQLADEAGRLLVELRARLHAGDAPSAVLKAQGDRQAHEFLMERLQAARPDDAILSEEGTDVLARLDAERTWIIDPLDGTREFSEVPRTDWAVHVALVANSRPIAGAVALPALGLLLSTANPTSLPPIGDSAVRLIVSRTRPPAAAIHVANDLGADLVEMGSAGAKTMAVVRGECEIYAHSGGQYEWDSCAPVAVAAAAGCHVSRINGQELLYNQKDPYLPDLLVCRPELAEATLTSLARFASQQTC